MPRHARPYARKPGISSSPAFFAAIVVVLLIIVLFVMNREVRTTPPPEQTSAASVDSDRFKTETKPKPAPAVAKSDPPRTPEPAAPVSSAMAPVKTPPERAPALTVETEEATPAPARAEEAREPEKARSVEETLPPAPETAERPVTPKKPKSAEKKTPPATALSLGLDEIERFLSDVRQTNVKTETAGGLEVTATLIPDTLAFRAAEKAKELFQRGNGAEKVLAEVKKYLASRRQAEGGKPLIEVSASPAAGWVLFMTTAGLQKSFKVRFDDSTIACDVAALTSLPSVTKWKIWFGKIAGGNEPKTVPLHYIARPLTVRLAARDRWPSGKNLTLSVLDFCHVLGKRRGPQDLEGVNTGMQQIHKPDVESFKTQAEILFARSEYRDVRAPAAFTTLLEK